MSHETWYRLCLIRVQLGRDAAVVARLRSLGKQLQAPGIVSIFYAFGACDIVAVFQGDEIELAFLTSGACKDIVSVEEIACYADKGPIDFGTFVNGASPLAGIAFIQAGNHSRADDFTTGGVPGYAFSSAGGAQIIYLRHLATLDDMPSWLDGIIGRGAQDSYSMLLIEAGAWDSLCQAGGKGATLGQLPINAEVHVHMAFSSAASLGRKTLDALASCSASFLIHTYHTLGSSDVVLVLRQKSGCSASLYQMTEVVEHVRKVGQGILASTATYVQFPLTTSRKDDLRAKPSGACAFSKKDAQQVCSIPVIGRRVARLLYAFGDALSDPLQCNLVCDMQSYYISVMERALKLAARNPKEPGYNMAVRELSEMMHFATRGIDQRLHGFKDGLRNTIPHTPWPLGGYAQIARGAESLAQWVFTEVARAYGRERKVRWPGFVLMGPYSSYLANASGVIVIPDSHMDHPGRWMGIVHEAAHCFMYASRDLNERLDKAARGDSTLSRRLQEHCADYIESCLSPYAWGDRGEMWHEEYWTYMHERGISPNDGEAAVAAFGAIAVHVLHVRNFGDQNYTPESAVQHLWQMYEFKADAGDRSALAFEYARRCFQDSVGSSTILRDQAAYAYSEYIDVLAVLLKPVSAMAARVRATSLAWWQAIEALGSARALDSCVCPPLMAWALWRFCGTEAIEVGAHKAYYTGLARMIAAQRRSKPRAQEDSRGAE